MQEISGFFKLEHDIIPQSAGDAKYILNIVFLFIIILSQHLALETRISLQDTRKAPQY